MRLNTAVINKIRVKIFWLGKMYCYYYTSPIPDSNDETADQVLPFKHFLNIFTTSKNYLFTTLLILLTDLIVPLSTSAYYCFMNSEDIV